MFNLFLAVSPEIFIINATFILLIHGVVFSTSKKDDYPPLVSNVGWLGLLSVARLGGQRAWDAEELLSPSSLTSCGRTAGNLSMGGRPNPFAAARPANRTQQEQGNSPGSGRHMSPNAIMNVRPTLHYVGTCACR